MEGQDQNQAQNIYPPPQFNMYPPQPIWGPKYDEEYLRHQGELTDKLAKLKTEIEKMPDSDLEQFKDQKLPLARIKKIMKSDEDVRMISAEAPILFAKACEMFIIEMTHKAYYYAKKNNRKTLQRNDIAAAITDTEIYDFLLDIMPRDEIINNAKDKQLSAYQRQLLDDAWNIQQLQSQHMQPPPGYAIGNQPQIPGQSPSSAGQQALTQSGNSSGFPHPQLQTQQQRELSYQQDDEDEEEEGQNDDQEEEKKPQNQDDSQNKLKKSNSKIQQSLQVKIEETKENDTVNTTGLSKKQLSDARQQQLGKEETAIKGNVGSAVGVPNDDQDLQDQEDGQTTSDQKRRSQRQTNKKTPK